MGWLDKLFNKDKAVVVTAPTEEQPDSTPYSNVKAVDFNEEISYDLARAT